MSVIVVLLLFGDFLQSVIGTFGNLGSKPHFMEVCTSMKTDSIYGAGTCPTWNAYFDCDQWYDLYPSVCSCFFFFFLCDFCSSDFCIDCMNCHMLIVNT